MISFFGTMEQIIKALFFMATEFSLDFLERQKDTGVTNM